MFFSSGEPRAGLARWFHVKPRTATMTQKVKMTVMYKAPPGETKVTEAFGHTFHDGKPEDIEVDEETAERIKTNPMFHPGGAEPDEGGKKHK
jgi:hypothetical protein